MIKQIGSNRISNLHKDPPQLLHTHKCLKNKPDLLNLSDSIPSWQPPKFYLDSLEYSYKISHHQYPRDLGSMQLVQQIANYHKKIYPKLDPKINIAQTNGTIYGMYCMLMAFVNPDDQVVFFDPAPLYYDAQVQLAEGISRRVPLKPKYCQSKQNIKQKTKDSFVLSEKDQWIIDFELLKKTINKKTKVIIIDSPHSIIGKVFSKQQLTKIAQILQQYPQIVVIQDNSLSHLVYDSIQQFPRISSIQSMVDRTLTSYCAGEMFGVTGVRLGWIIGNAYLISRYRAVNQYDVSCFYDFVQNTVTKCLQIISKPQSTYLEDYANKLKNNRNILLNGLIDSKFDFDLWIPSGGYYIVADISRCQIDNKYLTNQNENKITKNFAFCIQLEEQFGILATPCSHFYSKQNQAEREKYVIFSFCKDEQTLINACKKIKFEC